MTTYGSQSPMSSIPQCLGSPIWIPRLMPYLASPIKCLPFDTIMSDQASFSASQVTHWITVH
ncbi:hypothetical protein OTK49_00510 [Vibrio coralliirubri]|uniref:hypothetical protein n=1 Tax=Vibrio coralliirubri TaxID=1516159 RepID=UPI002283FDBD|nr:hypothetical protein [Vibrio coralliirubri]MCY9861023.1 hypothetical protein [Vibrio coralliirubri]